MSKRKWKKWTEDELVSLKEDYGMLSIREMEHKYERNYPSIKDKCRSMNFENKRAKKWTEEIEREFKTDWVNKNNSIEHLKIKYNTTRSGLASKAKELGVKRRNKDYSDLEIETMAKMYESGSTLDEIHKEFDCGIKRVKQFLKTNNVKERTPSQSHQTYKINERYFDCIDTERKAYMYGFFYADGHLSKKGSLSIVLQERDGYILEEFLKDMGSNHEVKTFKRKDGRKYTGMHVVNKHITDTLKGYGVDGNKTYSAKFPPQKIIGDDMIRHFIRGFFDGDGTVSNVKNKRYSAGMVGTYNMMWSVDYIIEYFTGVKGTIVEEPRSDKIYYYRVGGGKKVEKFLAYMYEDANIFLRRKHERYQNFVHRDKNIWDSRRKIHGEKGRSARTVTDKIMEFIKNDDATEYNKKELIERFTRVKDISNANLHYHTRTLISMSEKENGIKIKSGYGKVIVDRYKSVQSNE